ncbi:hypothetical protein WN943_004111 [Citrus x changshan-huyou]
MEKPVTSIPGFEKVFRRTDLPGICRVETVDEYILQFLLGETSSMSIRASAFVINTCNEIEAPMVSRLSSFVSKIYTSVLYMRYTNQVSENARLQFHPAVRPGPYYTSVWEFTGALSGTIVGVLAWDSQQWKTVLVGHMIRLDFGRIRNWPNSNGARRRNPRKEAYG